jgi:cytosine/adenosine deaminase-related metal-dependent hydrolase
MASLVIENGLIVTMDEQRRILKRGTVAVEDGKIIGVEKASEAKGKYKAEKVIDATGKIVMPGLICAHHHLYSTFAWWKLDNLLTKEDIYYSSLIPLIECVRNGTTTIIDHHESQSYQKGSLDEIARAVKEVGIRASLCLGTSDRYGRGKEGLEENEHFLSLLKSQPSELLKGMVGLHAAFTVNDDTLDESVRMARKYDVGIHVHCAEDKADEDENLTWSSGREVYRCSLCSR